MPATNQAFRELAAGRPTVEGFQRAHPRRARVRRCGATDAGDVGWRHRGASRLGISFPPRAGVRAAGARHVLTRREGGTTQSPWIDHDRRCRIRGLLRLLHADERRSPGDLSRLVAVGRARVDAWMPNCSCALRSPRAESTVRRASRFRLTGLDATDLDAHWSMRAVEHVPCPQQVRLKPDTRCRAGVALSAAGLAGAPSKACAICSTPQSSR